MVPSCRGDVFFGAPADLVQKVDSGATLDTQTLKQLVDLIMKTMGEFKACRKEKEQEMKHPATRLVIVWDRKGKTKKVMGFAAWRLNVNEGSGPVGYARTQPAPATQTFPALPPPDTCPL